jgi:hypothetical protein
MWGVWRKSIFPKRIESGFPNGLMGTPNTIVLISKTDPNHPRGRHLFSAIAS